MSGEKPHKPLQKGILCSRLQYKTKNGTILTSKNLKPLQRRKLMLRQFVYTFVVVFVSTSLLTAADWTVFHGPDGDNKSPDTGLLKKWSPGGPKLLWTADFLGSGFSGVSISGERIYTSGNVGNYSMVFCLDLDGNKVWEKENGPPHTGSYPGTRGTPTIDGDVVYDVSPLGAVTCFDAKTGDKKWSRNLMTEYEARQPRWILGHSVVVDGDNLICMVGDAKVLAVALNKKTGEPVMEFAPTAGGALTSYMTPYFFEFEGTRVLSMMSMETLEGYDARTGKRLFTIPWRNSRTTNVTAPLYRDGNLFLSSGYNYGAEGYKLAKNADGTITATKLWHTQQFDNHHHGLVLVGDHVYGTSSGGTWFAVNFLTGEIAYTARPVSEQTAVHYADGMIYCLAQDSRTVILWDPKPTEFVEAGRFVLPREAEGKAWAHPVVLNGRLYLRHSQYLYCYDVKE